jgi:hypothetical protein
VDEQDDGSGVGGYGIEMMETDGNAVGRADDFGDHP